MLTALLWILIVGTLIGLFIDFIRGIPKFLRELPLKNEKRKRLKEEEKWRKQKEKEYLDKIEWLKITPDIYQTKKNKNPYRKDFYYRLSEEFRGYYSFKKYGYDLLSDCNTFN
ncbi:hypothetical protein [uncultured Anaerovibrio sp.]|uniref:hypothetical protein n=1 Tax=uncultured Anaerovibrio sp. TaxID=361586 RepID=UPI0025F32091|nr:hypothetical protein [uncultured Anaerovibrio sp.]